MTTLFLTTSSFALFKKKSGSSSSSSKATCYSYNSKRGSYKDKQRKRCSGKWKATKQEALEYQKKKCEKKKKRKWENDKCVKDKSAKGAGKVKCYKYSAKKGKFRERNKKRCNGKSWFESEDAAVEGAKKKCLKKKRNREWDDQKKLCINTKKAGRASKRCNKNISKIYKYTEGQKFSFTFGSATVTQEKKEYDCSKISKQELKGIKQLYKCLKKIHKVNKKIAKKGRGKKVDINEAFDGQRCNKKFVRQSKGGSSKKCKKRVSKLKPEIVEKYGFGGEFCENPTKSDVKKLRQVIKCERKTKRGKKFEYDPKSGKCINLKRREKVYMNEISFPQMSSAKKQKCLKLIKKMKRRAKGDYVKSKHIRKLQKKKCIVYNPKPTSGN